MRINTQKHIQNGTLGFTLVEMVVSISIVAMVTMLFGTMLVMATRSERIIGEQSDAVRIADKATEKLTRLLREIRNGENGGYAIAAADANSVSVYVDTDDDGITEFVTISYSGTTVTLDTSKASGTPVVHSPSDSEVIATSVINTITNKPLFQYYSTIDDPTTATPLTEPVMLSDISMIEVQFDVNIDPDVLPSTSTVSTLVRPRNLVSRL